MFCDIFPAKMSLLGGLYSWVSRPVSAGKALFYKRGWKKPLRPPLPVVSVGNIALGGSGKTPLVIDLVAWAQVRGLKPAVVSRGYKGRWEKNGGLLSDGTSVFGSWLEAGDEPVLIARRSPGAGVFVGRHRFLSCRKAHEAGFDLVILDDGFQHLKLARDVDIVLHRPGRASALREGPRALRRAAIVLLESGPEPAAASGTMGRGEGPLVFPFRMRPESLVELGTDRLLPVESLRRKSVLAFCGIARPERFFGHLEELGLRVAARFVFPDHFDYPSRALARVASAAAAHRPEAVVTTEKDGVKIGEAGRRLLSVPVFAVRVGLELPPAFYEALAAHLARGAKPHA